MSFYRVSYCTVDSYYDKVFCYIARNGETKKLECHAFLCNKRSKVSSRITCINNDWINECWLNVLNVLGLVQRFKLLFVWSKLIFLYSFTAISTSIFVHVHLWLCAFRLLSKSWGYCLSFFSSPLIPKSMWKQQ